MSCSWKAAALALWLASSQVTSKLLHSLPEDTHAFPKYTVSFLNNLPVLNETAERWLRDGLRGGALEFLERPWGNSERLSRPPREIDGADSVSPSQVRRSPLLPARSIHHNIITLQQPYPSRVVSDDYSLEHMKMGSRDSYLCFVPNPLEILPPPPVEEPDGEISLTHAWSLLEPLSENCLYVRAPSLTPQNTIS